MSLTRQRVVAFLFPLMLSLPFVNRAYFVDDSYFVQIASWLKDNPTLPYHFRADDAGYQTRGWEEDGFVRMVNQLGHHYYLALLIKIAGAREGFLRLGALLLSCFSGLFIYEFARRWTARPLLSTLLVLVTPVHWLTAHSLLIDSTLGFLFLGALYFFMRGTETESPWRYALSGLFMGGVALTKYPGLMILPLTFGWAVLRWKKLRRPAWTMLAWVIGVGILMAWNVWTTRLYGRPHILAASARMVNVYGLTKILTFFVFFSGGLLLPVLSWRLLDYRRGVMYAALALIMTRFFVSAAGGFSLLQSALLAFWFVTTLVYFVAVARSRTEWIFPRDHFLVLWVGGYFLMMFVVMGWVAVRYYVIVAPAAVLLLVRMIELHFPEHQIRRLLVAAFTGTFLLSAALAYADYKQAETSRLIIRDLKVAGISGGERHFYLGDSFTGSYLKEEGWVPCFETTAFRPGDLVLAKTVTMPSIWFWRKHLPLRDVGLIQYPTRWPFKVMDARGSAGFYASVWGALPFSISRSPWERFRLFEVVKGDE
jgi:hypothetical protein